jgi:hypothetical protein
MPETVLILGNGISRLAFDAQIRAFKGEVWGCNFIYREYGDILARVTGHDFALIEAEKARDENGWKFDIYAGVIAKKRPGWKLFTQPPKWHKDSGSTLATQALHDGKNIICCGFDMGGADVYSPDHWQQNKTSWVRRWAEILKEFGEDRVTFWGHDHKPFLLAVSNGSSKADKYYLLYRGNRPHLINEGYVTEHSRRFGVFPARKKEVVKIQYENGYIAHTNRAIADTEIKRGRAVEIGVIKPIEEIPVKVIEKPVAPVADIVTAEPEKKKWRKKRESIDAG